MNVRRGSAIAIALVALAVFVWAYRQLWPFLIDDVFISLRYARNLAAGHGLVWNPGERVEGYTNFLWTLLLLPAFKGQFGIVPWVKTMNGFWAVLAFALTWRLAARLDSTTRAERPDLLWSVLPAAASIACMPFVLGAAEGLETMMFTALALLGTLCAWEARESDSVPRTALVVAALGMTRPEGVALVPWLLLVQRLRGRSWKFVMRELLVFVLVYGAYFATRWSWYGDLLPNTFYAKRGGDSAMLGRGFEETRQFFGGNGGWLWLLALGAFFAPGWRLAATAVLGLPLLRVAFELWSGGAWMGRDRFLVPAIPFLFLLLALSAKAVARRFQVPATVLVLVIALIGGWLRWPAQRDLALGYGGALRAAHLSLGQDVLAHSRPDMVLAMDDAGLGPLVADRTTVDMLGLNDRHIAHLPGSFVEKYDVGYVLGRRPDLLVLLTRTPADSVPIFRLPGHLALYEAPEFRKEFGHTRTYDFDPEYHLRVYRRLREARVDTTFWSVRGPVQGTQ